jgi:hypothetical protein
MEQALGKTSQKPVFSTKFKEAVPKTEVLKQPHLFDFLDFAVNPSTQCSIIISRILGQE